MKVVLIIASVVIFFGSIVTSANAAPCDNASEVVLNRPSGGTYRVCGTDDNGSQLFLYKGLKYATAARWQPPKSVEPAKDEVVQAKYFGAICPQDSTGTFLTPEEEAKVDQTKDLRNIQSEACLTLNIYTQRPSGKPRPVMLFIHGGAFLNGAGSVLDGTALARLGAIVVTFNYRLGALGFLVARQGALPHPAYTGNSGFLDQQMAMQWVFNNIEKFGGDANNITLFGESAGAMSVGLHTFVTPTSSDLFASAIMQSNPLSLAYSTDPDPSLAHIFILTLCKQYAKSGQDKHCTDNWMEKVSTRDIVTVQSPAPQSRKKAAADQDLPATPIAMPVLQPSLGTLGSDGKTQKTTASPKDIASIHLPWAPHVDGSLIVAQPLLGYAAAVKKRKPIVIGVNQDEGVVFSTIADLSIRPGRLDSGLYNGILTAAYNSQKDNIKSLERYDEKRVPPLPNLDPAIAAFGNVLTDHDFVCGAVSLANRVVDNESSQEAPPVFTYYFKRRPFFNLYLITAGGDPAKAADEGACAPLPNKERPTAGKVCHANELVYVFNMMDAFGKDFKKYGYNPDIADVLLASHMSSAWVEFASAPKSPAGKGWMRYTRTSMLTPVWDANMSPPIELSKVAHCDIWLRTPPFGK